MGPPRAHLHRLGEGHRELDRLAHPVGVRVRGRRRGDGHRNNSRRGFHGIGGWIGRAGQCLDIVRIVQKGHPHLDLLVRVRRRQRIGGRCRALDVGFVRPVHPEPVVAVGGVGQPVGIRDAAGRSAQRRTDVPRAGYRRRAGCVGRAGGPGRDTADLYPKNFLAGARVPIRRNRPKSHRICDSPTGRAARILIIGVGRIKIGAPAPANNHDGVGRFRRGFEERRGERMRPGRKAGRRRQRRAGRCREPVVAGRTHRYRVGISPGILGFDLHTGQDVAARGARTRCERDRQVGIALYAIEVIAALSEIRHKRRRGHRREGHRRDGFGARRILGAGQCLGVAVVVLEAHPHPDLLALVGRHQRVGAGGRPGNLLPVRLPVRVHPDPLERVVVREGGGQPVDVGDGVFRRGQRLADPRRAGYRRRAGGVSHVRDLDQRNIAVAPAQARRPRPFVAVPRRGVQGRGGVEPEGFAADAQQQRVAHRLGGFRGIHEAGRDRLGIENARAGRAEHAEHAELVGRDVDLEIVVGHRAEGRDVERVVSGETVPLAHRQVGGEERRGIRRRRRGLAHHRHRVGPGRVAVLRRHRHLDGVAARVERQGGGAGRGGVVVPRDRHRRAVVVLRRRHRHRGDRVRHPGAVVRRGARKFRGERHARAERQRAQRGVGGGRGARYPKNFRQAVKTVTVSTRKANITKFESCVARITHVNIRIC